MQIEINFSTANNFYRQRTNFSQINQTETTTLQSRKKFLIIKLAALNILEEKKKNIVRENVNIALKLFHINIF